MQDIIIWQGDSLLTATFIGVGRFSETVIVVDLRVVKGTGPSPFIKVKPSAAGRVMAVNGTGRLGLDCHRGWSLVSDLRIAGGDHRLCCQRRRHQKLESVFVWSVWENFDLFPWASWTKLQHNQDVWLNFGQQTLRLGKQDKETKEE